jgi:hypothetical protein
MSATGIFIIVAAASNFLMVLTLATGKPDNPAYWAMLAVYGTTAVTSALLAIAARRP